MATWSMQWIGTGSGLNHALGNTSVLLRGEGDRVALIDCGHTVPGKLIELGILDQVTDIALTHMHADHIGGLEALGFFNRHVLDNVDERRPHLHVGSQRFAYILWDHGLRAGMQLDQIRHGSPAWNTLETFFQVHTGTTIKIPGLPDIRLAPTPHIGHMENYAVWLGGNVFYSGDTYEPPPHDPIHIFQDCQFAPGDGAEVHIPYDRLRDELPPEVKAKTHLVHLGMGYEAIDPKADGFAGFVLPGDIFEF